MSIPLQTIIERLAQAVPHIDSTTTIQNSSRRTKENYLISARSLTEPQLVRSAAEWWASTHPEELPGFNPSHLEHPYPGSSSETCDLVIAADNPSANWAWALEIKKIALVGDNGKNNDYVLQKLLSPYLKDRSLLHDAVRLRRSGLAQRYAVIVIGFDFDSEAVRSAFQICEDLGLPMSYAKELQRVVKAVDPYTNEYRLDPVIDIAHQALMIRGLVSSPVRSARFSGLCRHPCGTEGLVCGWEVSQPSLVS